MQVFDSNNISLNESLLSNNSDEKLINPNLIDIFYDSFEKQHLINKSKFINKDME